MSDPGKAVFLSYASQDAEAAKRICDALRSAGVEVWFDQNELVGGDAWDAKIRGHIKTCTLFVPIISASTNARREGYFRREWKLAVDRTHDMDEALPFLVPVVIDDTTDAGAFVPEKFREVQWTRLPGGEAPPAFVSRVQKLLAGEAVGRGLRTPPLPMPAGFGDPALQRSSRRRFWWALPIFGVTLALVLVLKESRPPAPAQPAPAPALSAKSPARQLADKALAVALSGSGTLEQLRGAAGIAEKAAREDPLDGEIWAIAALVDLSFFESTIDASEKRRDALRAKLSQAKGLAPRAPLTRYAEAKTLARVEPVAAGLKAAEDILREMLAVPPPELTRENVLSLLVAVLAEQRRFAEAARLAEDAGLWSGAFWSYLAAGDLSRAVSMAERQTKVDQSGGLYLQMTVQFARGDLDAWAELLNRLPATALLEEQTISQHLWLAYYRRDAAALLAAARRFPTAYIENNAVKSPRGSFIGIAHQWAGQNEAAKAAWIDALQEVERRLAVDPKVGHLRMARMWLLAFLDRKEEARQALTDFRLQNQDLWMDADMSGLLVLLDQKEEALDQLEKLLRAQPRSYWHLHTAARYAAFYDPLRGDPRFEKLLRETLLPDAEPLNGPKSQTPYLGPSRPPTADAKSVAVLAFANLSDDKANEYFSDGISEELLNVLAKVPGLKVSARTSAFYFKGKEVPIPEIAKQLGVAYVVEGSVRKQGDKVRITAQLIKAADGFRVWSDTFTRDLKDIFAVQDEIAGLVVRQLRTALLAGQPEATAANPIPTDVLPAGKGRTANVEAYQLFLEGKFLLNLKTAESLPRSIGLFRRAVERDPGFALAWAHLAFARNWAISFGVTTFAEVGAEAQAAAREAVRLAPDLPEAQAALGDSALMAWDWTTAIRASEEALRLAPGNADVLQSASWRALVLGDLARSATLARQAIATDPYNIGAHTTLGMALLFSGRPDEVEPVVRQMEAINPGGYLGGVLQWNLHVQQGRWPEALAMTMGGADNQAFSRIICLYGLGRKAESDAELARVRAGAERLTLYDFAVLHAFRGEADAAFAQLEKARLEHSSSLLVLKNDPLLKNLRSDPRWTEFLRKLGLAADQLK